MKTINSKVVKPFKQPRIKSLKLLTIACALAVQTACMSTNPMNRERQLMQSGQLRNTSNIGAGQMVAADYTVSPEIMFAEKTASGKAIGGALLGGLGS